MCFSLIYPFRSPDFNSLDLGAWFSLSSGIPTLKAIPNGGRIIDRIISHVLERWNQWDSMTRLENIFSTKTRIIKAVYELGGSNEYKMPRSNRSHKFDKPTFIPKAIVEDEEMEICDQGSDQEERIQESDQEERESNQGSDQDVRVTGQGSDNEEEEEEKSKTRSLSQIFHEISTQNEVSSFWLHRCNQRITKK